MLYPGRSYLQAARLAFINSLKDVRRPWLASDNAPDSIPYPKVVGAGLGFVYPVGLSTPVPGVHVFVSEHVTTEEFGSLLAPLQNVPYAFLGIGAGRGAAGRAASGSSPRNPLVPGLAISSDHPDGKTATLGGFVTIKGATHLLTAGHVLDGLKPKSARGSTVHHPGRDFEPPTPTNLIGRVAQVFADIDVGSAAVLPGKACLNAPPQIGRFADHAVAPVRGLKVRMYGMTSGRTSSEILSIDATMCLEYVSRPRPHHRMFENVFSIKNTRRQRTFAFARLGDSGTWVVDTDRRPIGMVVWVTPSHVFAVPMTEILKRFEAQIL